MNKVTKGTLAAAAAGALLLGGAGTYATWKEETSVDAGTVSSGQLNLTSDTKATAWAYAGGAATPLVPEIVPGDVLTASYKVTIEATGDHMKGQLAMSGIDTTPHPNITVDLVARQLEPAVEGVTVNGRTVTFDREVTVTITVDVTITALDNAEENKTLDLTKLGLVLTQTPYVAPTAAAL